MQQKNTTAGTQTATVKLTFANEQANAWQG